MAPTLDPVDSYRAALLEAGLIPADVVPDGRLRRCPTAEKPRSQNGWHVLYPDPPAGAFGDWASGLSKTWSMAGEELPPVDRARLREEIDRLRAERKREQSETRQVAILKVRQYLDTLPPAKSVNAYLERKGVASCPGLLADGPDLIVPMAGPDGKPISFQRVKANGEKKNAPGCPSAGGFFAIKSDDGPLLVCEGIATGLSLHQATCRTVLCCFSAGNLETVARMARTRYAERQIILCADNDTETEARTGKNTGVDAARAAALAVGGLLAIPAAEGDWNDLHQAEGPDAVRAGIDGASTAKTAKTATATSEDWPEPMPLCPEDRPEPHPMEALPGLIGDAVREITGFVQCPAALTACAALSAVSTVAAGLVDVRRADRLSGPTGLYFLAVADSGERKTTVDQFFTGAIRHWEAAQEEILKPEVLAWKAADDAWKAERDGVTTAIREKSKRDEPTVDLKARLEALENQKPERPKVPQLLVGDSTSEALTWRLANLWPVAGILSSEAGVVFGGHAMGRESIMRNLATLNSLWDGQPLSVDRRTSESYTVSAARLTLGLAVQPETVSQFIESARGLARGSGFLARFLVAWPQSTQGRRPFHEAPESWPALARFHRRLAELLDCPVNFDAFGRLSPSVLGLDPAAKALWVRFHDDIERELAPGGDLAEIRDVASKAGDNAARLAALFHVFENGPTGTIGQEHMGAAARVVAWHLFEARRFLNQITTPEAVGDALALEAWLIQRCTAEHLAAVPVSLCHKSAPNRLRKKAALEAALDELESAGRIRRRRDGRRVEIVLNPAIIGGHHGA